MKLGSTHDEATAGARAVSDVFGFAVVFGIVLLAIALFYTFGTAALADLQHDHAMDNAERAFDIVADNMADVHQNDAPGRGTELQFASGELGLSGTTTIRITNATDTDPRVAVVATSTPLRYTSHETGLYYAAGAVIRTDRGRAGMVHEPPFTFGADRTVISLVETASAAGGGSVGGAGSAQVSARNEGSTIERIVDEPITVTVSVTSPRYRAWERYFASRPTDGSVTVESSTNTVTYTFDTDGLFVRRTRISVGITA